MQCAGVERVGGSSPVKIISASAEGEAVESRAARPTPETKRKQQSRRTSSRGEELNLKQGPQPCWFFCKGKQQFNLNNQGTVAHLFDIDQVETIR